MAEPLDLLNMLFQQKKANEEQSLLQQVAGNQPSNSENVVGLLKSNFKNPKLISALMGNMDVETGGTFDYKQKQIGGGKGVGLYQMTYKPMKEAYSLFLDRFGLDDSADAQIGFLRDILESDQTYDIGAGNRTKLKKIINTGSVEDITEAISDKVLRPGKPHIDRRKKSSLKWYDTINSK